MPLLPPLLAALLLALPAAAPGRADDAPTAAAAALPEPSVDAATGVKRYRDVAYVAGDAADPKKHRLDLFLPAEGKWRAGRPVVVWIHGGGWRMGDKDDAFGLYNRYCRILAEHGVAAANVSYRLSPGVKHPAHVQDVAAATGWVARHAETFGYDPKHLFVSGHSAGGHLAALLAADPRWLAAEGLTPGSVAGAIPSSGVFDLRPLVESSARWRQAFTRESADDASPVTHVSPGEPPFAFVVEQNGDFMRSQTRQMLAALRKAGATPEVTQVPGVNHITMLQDLLYRDGRHATATLKLIDRVVASAAEEPESELPARQPDAPAR